MIVLLYLACGGVVGYLLSHVAYRRWGWRGSLGVTGFFLLAIAVAAIVALAGCNFGGAP